MTAHRSPTCRRPSPATTDQAVRTEEQVIGILLPVVSLELSDDGRAALALQRESTYPVGFILKMDFTNSVEKREADYGKSLVETVDLVVMDPPTTSGGT